MNFDPIEEAIFVAASELEDRAAREAFLERACAGDLGLKGRIERLLSAGQKANDFFQDDPLRLAAKENTPPNELADASGERIGRYKLLQKIGEGGMGLVYMAEQQEPVRRRVALKIIKLGMDTRAVVARFEAERQALALMDHPNIARILDGGATESGRPYFVMELVQGVPITEYCDKNRLSVSARIELFLKVCEAVQSAHQKGIIHRDLKPSNIMVTLHDGVPVPKVIDFGVAKATNQELTTKTLFTNYATLIGTPAYMSPEQAEMSGLDVDTRSDIYSLGTILYELLTGTTPFPEQRLRSVGYGEMQKIITQEEPQRLPTRLSTMEGETRTIVLQNRAANGLALRKELSGDLDSIVMKCLEKDRTRRYESASAIAADIRRHQKNEPVAARPQTAAYRMQKFISRNKLAAGVTAGVALAILASLVIATVSYRKEKVARAAAEQSEKAEITARREAEKLTARAEAEALRAARFQYASDMNLARLAAEEGNLFRALQLLEQHRPSNTNSASKALDLRGWEWRYLWRKCQSEEIATLGHHLNGVLTVGFFPDGKTAFSGGSDNMLRLWDMRTMKETRSIPHGSTVMGAAVSPDGRWFVSNTDTLLTIREWGQETAPFKITHSWFRPNTLIFSPDSKLLAFGEYTKGLIVFDLAERREIAQMPATFGWMAPLGAAFSPDGKMLAYAASSQGEVALWNVERRSEANRWKAHDWYIPRLFFTQDGKQLISGSADRTTRIWDLETTRELERIDYPLGFGPSRICAPRLSADGKFLASATAGGGVAITIQEMPSGKEIRKLLGNKDMVSDVAFSPDGQTLISGSYDGSVRLWNLGGAKEKSETPQNPISRIEPMNGLAPPAPSPIGWERVGVRAGLVHGEVLRLGSNVNESTVGTFFSTVLSPDGEYLLTIYTNQTFRVVEVRTGKESPGVALPALATSIALSTAGKTAAFVPTNGPIIFWERATGKFKELDFAATNRTWRSAFSLDGSLFATPAGGSLFLFNLQTGEQQSLPINHFSSLFLLNFSDDSKILMAGYWSGQMEVWDFRRANPVISLEKHPLQVNGTALLPGNKIMVSVSREIWFSDLETGKTIRKLQPRPALFRSVAVSPDGRRLAVGAADGIITIWDLDSMQEVATLYGHKRPMLELKFLADGDTLVSLDVTELRVWRAAPADKLGMANK